MSQRFATGLHGKTKAAVLSPRVRPPPQRMVSVPSGDHRGPNGEHCLSPAPLSRSSQAVPGNAPMVSPSGHAVATSSAGAALNRSSLGGRAGISVGARQRNSSTERYAGTRSVPAPEDEDGTFFRVHAGGASSPSYSPAAAMAPGSPGQPRLWASSPSTAVYHAWGVHGQLASSASISPRVAMASPSAPGAQDFSMSPATQGMANSMVPAVLVSGLRYPASHSPGPVTAPWPRPSGTSSAPSRQFSGDVPTGVVRQASGRAQIRLATDPAVDLVTGALTPGHPHARMMPRSASEVSGGASTGSRMMQVRAPSFAGPSQQVSTVYRQESLSRSIKEQEMLSSMGTDPTGLRAQMERLYGPGGAAAAAVAAAKECQDAKLETEFLRRIQALEAKVGDREALLAKLSRQQARLDRLENLARENEILKAQMRGDQRRGAGGNAAGGVKDHNAGRRLGINRQASGRVKLDVSPEVRILTVRDAESVRREASPPQEDGGEPEPESTGMRVPRVVPPGSASAQNVHRSLSSETFSHSSPDRDRMAPVAPRRMVSAPQECVTSADALKASEPLAPTVLESRLEELELALGLQPGVCAKPSLGAKTNAVNRERSV